MGSTNRRGPAVSHALIAAERERRVAILLVYLADHGPTCGATLGDDLAARCGDRGAVATTRVWMSEQGLVRAVDGHGNSSRHGLTEAGVVAAEEAKKTLAQRRAERRAA